MRPNILVQLSTRERVAAFRSGLGDVPGVVVVGLDAEVFSKMAGLDALYMSITRAERWGSRPPPAYESALLRTTAADRQAGMPPYILTGLVLQANDPNTASFAVPILVRAVRKVVDDLNATQSGAIRSIGFFEFELKFAGTDPKDVGRAFAEALSAR